MHVVATPAGAPLRPRFGAGSAQAHRDDGALALTGVWPGLLRDVDDLDDLRAAVGLGVGPATADLLATSPTLAVQLGAAR